MYESVRVLCVHERQNENGQRPLAGPLCLRKCKGRMQTREDRDEATH
jgi:hypothetical protein